MSATQRGEGRPFQAEGRDGDEVADFTMCGKVPVGDGGRVESPER